MGNRPESKKMAADIWHDNQVGVEVGKRQMIITC